jgi:hypothetical protein
MLLEVVIHLDADAIEKVTQEKCPQQQQDHWRQLVHLPVTDDDVDDVLREPRECEGAE